MATGGYRNMPTLSDKGIRNAIEQGEINIEPFDEDLLEPASLDLTLGDQAFLQQEDDIQHIKENGVLAIPPGETVLILTEENIELGNRHAANIGLRSTFSRKGIDLLAGPQIDPGFSGHLHIVLVNLSPSKVHIERGEPILTIEFRELDEPADESYEGELHMEDTITAEEVRDLKKGEGMALSEAVKAMKNIAKDVGALKDSVDRQMQIFTASIVTLVLGVLTALSIIVYFVVVG